MKLKSYDADLYIEALRRTMLWSRDKTIHYLVGGNCHSTRNYWHKGRICTTDRFEKLSYHINSVKAGKKFCFSKVESESNNNSFNFRLEEGCLLSCVPDNVSDQWLDICIEVAEIFNKLEIPKNKPIKINRKRALDENGNINYDAISNNIREYERYKKESNLYYDVKKAKSLVSKILPRLLEIKSNRKANKNKNQNF